MNPMEHSTTQQAPRLHKSQCPSRDIFSFVKLNMLIDATDSSLGLLRRDACQHRPQNVFISPLVSVFVPIHAMSDGDGRLYASTKRRPEVKRSVTVSEPVDARAHRIRPPAPCWVIIAVAARDRFEIIPPSDRSSPKVEMFLLCAPAR